MKWINDTTNPAGPIQVKRVNDALSKLRMEHNTSVEITGIKGGEENRYTGCLLFGGNVREDVTAAMTVVGEKYKWTLTRENAADVAAELLAEWPALIEGRPVKDSRRTPEEEAERNAAVKQAEEERRIESEAKGKAEALIAADLLAKYPWALPASSPLSGPARAAANLKTELSRTWPAIKFSVKSVSFSMGNAVDVSWTLGPTVSEVKAVAGKYQGGSFDGMTDSYNENTSAFSGAVETILGTAKYVHEHRSVDEESLVPLLLPALCELLGVPYDPTVKPYDLRLPDNNGRAEYGGTAIRCILHGQSFPAGAVITGIERNPSEGGAATWENMYRATFEVRQGAAPVVAVGEAAGTVAYNEEHNGIEVGFPGKPDGSVITALKGARFRWSPRSKVWYAKATDYALEAAAQIAGLTVDDRAKIKREMDGAHETAGVRGMEEACGIA